MSMGTDEILGALQEMEQGQQLIISDSDREFVLGLALMCEMGEPVSASYFPRVEKIYREFQQNQVR